ncbi:hypothetical protein MTR67_035818 [Solanum verrucosum]|uniref:Uncharacterized protein n=1 Tax=Solanum verrucosum TaxID=315347 RepID=A0AAF0UAU6_SOLVR|nr:hypothetical protein MTR67_035818 [Solanum verrucosum]
MLLRGYPLQKKIEFPMSSNNFSFSLVNCCGVLLLSGVDTNSALAPAAATVIKRPEVIHVPGSAKVSAIRVLEKYLNRQENDNVATVVLTGKQNLEEYVQFSRSANFPASVPLTFADALTNIVDQIEIRAHIFGDCLRFPFDPGDCFHLCSCLLRCFLEVKEVLKEGLLILFGNRALVGQTISWNFPLFMAHSIYYNTILNILGIGKSRLYISNFERLGQGGRSIADNLQWWLTRDTLKTSTSVHARLPAHKQKMSSYCTITYLRTTKSLCQRALNVSWNPGTSSGHLPQVDNPSTSSWHLPQTLEMLEKKEKVLLKKAAAEVEKAKEFTRAKNKRVFTAFGIARTYYSIGWCCESCSCILSHYVLAKFSEFDDSSNQFLLFLAAIQCLKRKRLYEQQIEQLGNFQLRIHDQMIMLEGAKATTETVDALRTGAAAMKAMQKATNIDDVDKTMDEINEQTENMKLIQEALSTPIGSAADFDEDELEAELEELEGAELEEQLLQPATTAPNAPINLPAGRQQVRPAAQKTEEDELAALQAEMAL